MKMKFKTSQKKRDNFAAVYHAGDIPAALEVARKLVKEHADCPFAWKSLGVSFLELPDLDEAEKALLKAGKLNSKDAEVENALGKLWHLRGDAHKAVEYLQRALRLNPNLTQARVLLTKFLIDTGHHEKAVDLIDEEIARSGSNITLENRKSRALVRSGRFSEGVSVQEKIVENYPNDAPSRTNLANLYRSIGRFKEAEENYLKAHQLAPKRVEHYSNYLMALHYNPDHSAEFIFSEHNKFYDKFLGNISCPDLNPIKQGKNNRLRIGFISAGFKTHPVGQMITTVLENLPRSSYEIYAYAMHDDYDGITQRIINVSKKWQSITNLTDDEVFKIIQEDGVDILFDLAGHTEGNRLLTFARKPSPIQIKWVGGQINTTGLHSIDYFLSDPIETPEGVDQWYTEKIIRMPDDYICYMARGNTPTLQNPPFKKNGFITFGCFNNPSKINIKIIEKWSVILTRVEKSVLFLKGNQYDSLEFVERIRKEFEVNGIDPERIIFESSSPHYELLDTYNKIDIALDPWPYSGGLTTCEALLMGVPVITLPGPTFAGRHSATHLYNAGLGEWIAKSWDDYFDKVIQLANNPEVLEKLKFSLPNKLLSSPVCDAKRYAKFFNIALRAIWHRYCEGLQAERVDVLHDGSVKFADENEPRFFEHVQLEIEKDYIWKLSSKIVTLDSGGLLIRNPSYIDLLRKGVFSVVSFDPKGIYLKKDLENVDDIQVLPYTALASGDQQKLYVTLDPEYTSLLKPLACDYLSDNYGGESCQVISEITIQTISFAHIDAKSIDFLVIDKLSDFHAISSGIKNLNDKPLVILMEISFDVSHENQATIADVQTWSNSNGYQIYSLFKFEYGCRVKGNKKLKDSSSSQIISLQVVLVPSEPILKNLENSKALKLAFIVDSIFNMRDLAYQLIERVDPENSELYLQSHNLFQSDESFDAANENSLSLLASSDLHLNGIDDKTSVNQDEMVQVDVSTQVDDDLEGFKVPDAPYMSDEERALFKKYLDNATCYFEFGSGGSSVWAAKNGLTVYGVESDAKFVASLKEKLGDLCKIDVVDIGPTGDWGYPIDKKHIHKFKNYSHAILKHNLPFDLILVDGRFRVACVMTAIQYLLEKSKKSEQKFIFIHDFWDRPIYHSVIKFLDLVERKGTAAVFKVKKNVKLSQVQVMLNEYVINPQ